MSMQQHKTPTYQFHTTQQLGFKPILYCWCGASLDLNKNYKRSTLKAFKLAHEGVCEPTTILAR